MRWVQKAVWASFLLCNVAVAEPPVVERDLPRIAATEPDKAAVTIHLHKGLRLELVVAEPLVSSPVGICFDEDARLFVVEMLGYPDLRAERPGRIKMLESTRCDGHYDKVTVYADNLPWPTSVMVVPWVVCLSPLRPMCFISKIANTMGSRISAMLSSAALGRPMCR